MMFTRNGSTIAPTPIKARSFGPGVVLLILGLLITLPLSFGPLNIGPIALSRYTSLMGLAVAIVGLQSSYLGCVAQVIYNYSPRSRQRWLRLFAYTRTVILAAAMSVMGVCLLIPLVVRYLRGNFLLYDLGGLAGHLAVTGLLFLIFGFMTFTFTLVLHAAALRGRKRVSP